MKQKATFSIRRFTLLMLLVLASLLSVVACTPKKGNETPTEPVADDPTGTEEYNPLNDLPEADFGGRAFTVLSEGTCGDWLVENSGEQIGESKYARTLAFEAKYHTTIYLAGATASDVKRAMEASLQLNDKSYDLVQPHPHTGLAAMMTMGCFANLYEIPEVNLNGAWYNESWINNCTTANGKLYAAVSDITIDGQGFFGIVYNRELMANYTFETDVKTLVENGDWTMEKLNEMVTVTEGLSSGDESSRVYGFLFNVTPLYRWMYAMDETIIEKKSDGTFKQGYTSEKMAGIANHLYTLMYGHDDAVMIDEALNAQLKGSNMYKAFTGKRGLFIAWDIGAQYPLLRGLEFKVGYAPLPKYDKAQPDYRVNCASGMLCIPAVTSSYAESGMGFEFLSVHSHMRLVPTFYEVILGGRLSEYPEDYEMLEFLHSKKYYDFGFTLDADQKFLGLLQEILVDNNNPDAIAINLKGKSQELKKILDMANGTANG